MDIHTQMVKTCRMKFSWASWAMWLHIFRLQIHISAWANRKPEFLMVFLSFSKHMARVYIKLGHNCLLLHLLDSLLKRSPNQQAIQGWPISMTAEASAW